MSHGVFSSHHDDPRHDCDDEQQSDATHDHLDQPTLNMQLTPGLNVLLMKTSPSRVLRPSGYHRSIPVRSPNVGLPQSGHMVGWEGSWRRMPDKFLVSVRR